MTTFTVTATQTGSTDIGMEMLLTVLTGQAASPLGNVLAATSATPNLSFTPASSNSVVFGALLGAAGTWTAESGTTFDNQFSGVGLEFIALHASPAGATTNIGSSTGTGISISLAEFKGAASAPSISGTGPPAVTTTTAHSLTTAAFTPPAGSLLVLAVNTNGNSGTVGMTVTDTSGLGLTWNQAEDEDAAGDGYSGVWYAVMPGGGTPHTVGASLTVAPVFNVGRTRGWVRGASLTVTPSFQAGGSKFRTWVVGAALTVTPSFAAGRIRGRIRQAALTISPVLHAAGLKDVSTTQTLTAPVECDVYAGLTLEATIKMNVGAPYQGDIRNLATDRWYPMYPS